MLELVGVRDECMNFFVNLCPTMLEDPNWFTPFIETYTSEKLPWATTPAVRGHERFPGVGSLEEFGRWAGRKRLRCRGPLSDSPVSLRPPRDNLWRRRERKGNPVFSWLPLTCSNQIKLDACGHYPAATSAIREKMWQFSPVSDILACGDRKRSRARRRKPKMSKRPPTSSSSRMDDDRLISDGASDQKRANTRVKTLRAIYGNKFAVGHSGGMKIRALLEHTGNTAIVQMKKGESSTKIVQKKPKVSEKNIWNGLSGKSITTVANASVRFGPALKKLADK